MSLSRGKQYDKAWSWRFRVLQCFSIARGKIRFLCDDWLYICDFGGNVFIGFIGMNVNELDLIGSWRYFVFAGIV